MKQELKIGSLVRCSRGNGITTSFIFGYGRSVESGTVGMVWRKAIEYSPAHYEIFINDAVALFHECYLFPLTTADYEI